MILLSLLTVFGLFEYYTYRVSINELQNRISDMARSQSEVIAESLWHLDNERINVILKAIMVDRDVVAASVDDELGKPLAAIGKPGKFADIPGHTHRHEITFRSTDRDEVIGNLIIIHGDATIAENAKRRLTSGALLCVLLLVSAVISALVANWRTIGVPMGRLLGAIKAAEQSGTHETVDWKVRDEFGDLVAAFNRMQRQQQRYETELTEAREDLERRVEERTGELRQAQDEAETANRAKTQFLQGMSHELRTPLNAILGFSDMIRMQAMRPGSEIEYAGDINKSAHFLLDIVNDLLDLSRIEAEAYQPDDRLIDPLSAIHECIEMMRPDAEAKTIRLTGVLPDKAPSIRADERMLKQVFVNVLSNAVKFTDHGGHVEIAFNTDLTAMSPSGSLMPAAASRPTIWKVFSSPSIESMPPWSAAKKGPVWVCPWQNP
ncbi:MAG: hypothetical protein HN540_12985 [Rhodospirillaceae bacterium]|nr:hypothetical protein [Rhodospirillaceae bacterium]